MSDENLHLESENLSDPDISENPPEEAAEMAEAKLQLDVVATTLESTEGEPALSGYSDYILSGLQSLLKIWIPGVPQHNYKFTDDEIDDLAIFQYNGISQSGFKRRFPDWHALIHHENREEWERRCMSIMGPTGCLHPLISQFESYRSRLRAFLGSWNPSKDHCSPNIYLLSVPLTAHRMPAVNQTDAIRGTLGFSRGVHAWDMQISGSIGTHCSVGVSTSDAPLSSKAGYISLIGSNKESWGWDIAWGNISHRGKEMSCYPRDFAYVFTSGDTVRLILDCEKGTLSYAVNEVAFGEAFRNLPRKTLYPTVSVVFGNTEVSLIYLGEPPQLRNITCSKVPDQNGSKCIK